jgi:hypothetical protein
LDLGSTFSGSHTLPRGLGVLICFWILQILGD